jgi:hypothetical protein
MIVIADLPPTCGELNADVHVQHGATSLPLFYFAHHGAKLFTCLDCITSAHYPAINARLIPALKTCQVRQERSNQSSFGAAPDRSLSLSILLVAAPSRVHKSVKQTPVVNL